jgi:DNA-binding transcriptional MerR regulator
MVASFRCVIATRTTQDRAIIAAGGDLDMADRTLDELAAQHGLTRRVIRAWIADALLPKPEARGPRTTYDADFQERLAVVVALRRSGLRLEAIRRKLTSMTRDEVRAALAPPGAAAPARAPQEAQGPPAGETWQRVELVPGLELFARVGAGPLVTRLRDEIRSRYGVAKPEG